MHVFILVSVLTFAPAYWVMFRLPQAMMRPRHHEDHEDEEQKWPI